MRVLKVSMTAVLGRLGGGEIAIEKVFGGAAVRREAYHIRDSSVFPRRAGPPYLCRTGSQMHHDNLAQAFRFTTLHVLWPTSKQYLWPTSLLACRVGLR